MENPPNPISPLEPSFLPPFPTPPPQVNAPNHWKVMALVSMVLLIIVVSGVAVAIGFFVGKQQNSTSTMVEPSPGDTSATLPTLQPTIAAKPIPADWTMKTSKTCMVSFPFPPKKAPYLVPDSGKPGVNDDGAYWQYYEEKTSSQPLFDKGFAEVIHKQDDAANGYVGGSVEVNCAPNDAHDTNQTLATKLLQLYPKHISTGTAEDLGAITIAFQADTTMWGETVKVANFSGGMYGQENYYIFATPTSLYMVRKVAMSGLDSVQQTAQQILENLQFEGQTTLLPKKCPTGFTFTQTQAFSVCLPTRFIQDSYKKTDPFGLSARYKSNTSKEIFSVNERFVGGWGGNPCFKTNAVTYLGQNATQVMDVENLSNSEPGDPNPTCGQPMEILVSLENGAWAVHINGGGAAVNLSEFNQIRDSFILLK